MDETIKKNEIVRTISEIECYPIIQEEVAIQEYTKISIGEFSAMRAAFV